MFLDANLKIISNKVLHIYIQETFQIREEEEEEQ